MSKKLKYHSIILLEIINYEDFDTFISGLNRLFSDLDLLEKFSLKKVEKKEL